MHWHIALFNVHCIISLKDCNSCRGQWLKKNKSIPLHDDMSPTAPPPLPLKKFSHFLFPLFCTNHPSPPLTCRHQAVVIDYHHQGYLSSPLSGRDPCHFVCRAAVRLVDFTHKHSWIRRNYSIQPFVIGLNLIFFFLSVRCSRGSLGGLILGKDVVFPFAELVNPEICAGLHSCYQEAGSRTVEKITTRWLFCLGSNAPKWALIRSRGENKTPAMEIKLQGQYFHTNDFIIFISLH